MWIVIAVISMVFNVLFVSAIVIAIKKLNSFHNFIIELEKFLFDSINYFNNLLKTPVFLNVPEVVEANNNMKKIRDQLEQFTKLQGGEIIIVDKLLE